VANFNSPVEPGEGFALVARRSGKDAITGLNSGRPTHSDWKRLERLVKPHQHQK
jgi:hypothetical protein